MVDQEGQAIIIKNNVPRYLVIEFSQAEQEQKAAQEQMQEQIARARVEIRRELETLRLTLRDKLDRQDRETLLKLTDLAIELREDVSLASFTAGFQLALGIARELTPYSFEDDEEERALRRQEQET